MKILLTGANGQLGQCVQDVFQITDHQLIALDRESLDIADCEAVVGCVAHYEPDVIINAAAYTAVDKAEEEPDLARAINAQGAGNLAKVAGERDIWLVHISTDYVFDGMSNKPLLETDEVNPQSVYGRTKLDGEHQVQMRCKKHIILRTAWVFSEYGNNFVKTMLRLGGERASLSVVEDQYGCPTYAGDIARACLAVVNGLIGDRNVQSGVYHFVSEDQTNWFEFASFILNEAFAIGLVDHRVDVVPITTAEFPTLAVRPQYSVLDAGRFHHAFGVRAESWRSRVSQVLKKICDTR